MRKHGTLISMEGLDASGKTTHAHKLVRSLLERGFEALYTTEPSAGQLGRFVKGYILQRKARVAAAVEALLFAVDRVDHLEGMIKPALKDGKVVISDRYLHSSLAYQGGAGLDLDWIREMNRFALPPDLAIYLDISSETAIKRLRRKKSVMETLQTQRRVRKIYMTLVKDGQLRLIDGNRAEHKVAKDVLSTALNILKKKSGSPYC